MTITFYSNFINHHQVPVADELYKILGSKYSFVSTMPLPQSFKDNGYPDYSEKPYLVNAYINKENQQKALELGLSSDIVIIGSASDIYIKERLKSNKLTFRYSERWFKTIGFHLLSPKLWFIWYKYHTKYRNKKLYMLCSSAYTVNDVSKIMAYPDKCYKWGYFPEVKPLDIDKILENKRNDCFKLLWVSRWIDWKHPELPIKLAYILKRKGYNFHIKMAGVGPLQDKMRNLCKSLDVEDQITLLGSMSNNKIIDLMKESNAFLFTSDRNEGWGAVLNEAMSNGCTVVASHMIGSVPYLIQNNINGLIFESENLTSLTIQVEKLLNNSILCEYLAKEAYKTLSNIWSPRNAAKSLLELSESLLLGEQPIIKDGPCSKAIKTIENEIISSISQS